MNHRFFVICDILALAITNIILWVSLYIQFVHHELPCPLCLLQRMGMFGIGIGYILNLYFGVSARHYALGAIAAILNGSIAMIQVLMHIVPETGNYGSPFLGLHLYTWVFTICAIFIIANLILITLTNEAVLIGKTCKKIATIVVIPLLLCLIINIVSAFAECGIYECPSDPTSYWINNLFKKY